MDEHRNSETPQESIHGGSLLTYVVSVRGWPLHAAEKPGHGDHSKDTSSSSGPALRVFSVLGTGVHSGNSCSQHIPILPMRNWGFREVG